MTIQSVFDPSFSKYGQVLTGYDLTGLLDTLERVTPVPEGTEYVPEQPELMALPVCGELSDRAYGGMPIQIGWCNGHNTRLNCLEYHRDSELNVGVQDFILLLAKREEMADGRLDTGKVEAFLCPAGTLVEVYATTLHYAPCSAKAGEGFQVASRPFWRAIRRTSACGPGTSGCWPTRTAARPLRARPCAWTEKTSTLPGSSEPAQF